jgi:histidinol-phosphate aminotransferase
LSDNTNLWGAPPAAERALRDTLNASLAGYPVSPYGTDLKRALAAYVGVTPEQIATGCGSDDVLDAAIRAFGAPGSRVAVMDPTFVMIPVFARVNGLEPVLVPLKRNYDVDVDAMLAVGASIIYLCSPNNPTGTVLDPAAIEAIAERATGLVIVDEAYAEFAPSSALDLARRNSRVLVARTMSKAFGLAGLRIGYAVGDPALIAEVEKSRGPFKVSSAAERAAIAALSEDLAWVREKVVAAEVCRGRFGDALVEMGLDVVPSHTNFVLVPVKEPVRIATALRERGIAVRPFTLPQISEALAATSGGALRITIGPWEILEPTLAALREVLA